MHVSAYSQSYDLSQRSAAIGLSPQSSLQHGVHHNISSAASESCTRMVIEGALFTILSVSVTL